MKLFKQLYNTYFRQPEEEVAVPIKPQVIDNTKITIPESVSNQRKEIKLKDKVGTAIYDPNIKESPIFTTYREEMKKIIRDRVGKSLEDKNIADKLANSFITIASGESQMDPKAQRINLNKSIDTGLFQINNKTAADLQKRYNLPEYDKNDYNSQINYALVNYADGGRDRWNYYKNNQTDYKKQMEGLADLTEEESQKARDYIKAYILNK